MSDALADAATFVEITCNGDARRLPQGTTVERLIGLVVSERSLSSPRGIAVAVNLDIVPRSLWAHRELADRDRVDVLTAAQGG